MCDTVSKWCVIYLDCLKSDAKILSVFTDSRDALTFMNSKVDENEDWNNEKYYRKHHNGSNMISIYQTNWFTEKTLICRYLMSHYYDC
jgi:hypothetical protein